MRAITHIAQLMVVILLFFLPFASFAELSEKYSRNAEKKATLKSKPANTPKKASLQVDKTREFLHKSEIQFSGFIDGSYNYLERSDHFTSGIHNRVFDINENGLTLQQSAVTLGYQPKNGLGGLITPVIGRDTYTFAPYGWDPDLGSRWFGFAIPESYLQYGFDSLTLKGGSLLELAGAETLYSLRNSNFSRGILYGYAEPFTVMGFRARYVADSKLTLWAGVNNGWDNIRDTGRRKTLEASFALKPSDFFSLAGTLYSGGQRAEDRTGTGPESIRNLFDIIFTFHVTSKFDLITNYNYGTQAIALLSDGTFGKAVWQGVAQYINYQFNDEWRTSFRGEIFSDRNGYRTGVRQTWDEVTLTLGYIPCKNIEFRAETRRDFSNVSSFVNKNGVTTSNNQQSFALEGIFHFA